jgi:hypothetical protein
MLMSRLTSGERQELPSSDFAYVDQSGGRHLPIENAEHVRDAMSRWPRTYFESCAAQEEARQRILAAAERFGIDVSADDFIVVNSHPGPTGCSESAGKRQDS